jgi:hypothetical protein
MQAWIGWPEWLPFLGWRVLDDTEVVQLELDTGWRWELFEFSWFGHGFAMFATATAKRPTVPK